MHQEIRLKSLEKPAEKDTKMDLFWVCDSFGLVAGRDINNISSRIVFDLLERLAEGVTVSSEIIATDLSISPARVNHHIRGLTESGMIYREKRLILLRGGSMKAAVDSIRKDANRILDELEEIAEGVDSALGLKNRE